MTKSGVAVDGKAATEPANGKANGQVSVSDQTRVASTGGRVRHQTAPVSMADTVEEIRLGACAEQSATAAPHHEFTVLVQSLIQKEAR